VAGKTRPGSPFVMPVTAARGFVARQARIAVIEGQHWIYQKNHRKFRHLRVARAGCGVGENMITSVTAKSNHYETLGLTSTASTEEIGKAYAAQMTTFRLRPENALKRLALLSTAYETLRDPAKRRAYDDSLGLNAPPVVPEPVVAKPVAPRATAPFIGATSASQFNRPRPTPAPPPAASKRRAEPDPRVGSFIAASLRQPAPKSAAVEWPVERPAEVAAPAPAPMYVEPGYEEEHARIHKNQAMIGAGIIGLAVLGVATALSRPNVDHLPAPTVQAQQAVTVGLPPATPAKDSAVGTPIEASAKSSVARQQVPVETAQAPAAELTPAPEPQTAQPVTQRAAVDPLAPIGTEANTQPASEANATDAAAQFASAASATAAAAMPLGNATITQTIHRIGYSCGSVASTEAVSGAKGVFKVTCSSGDSYQATPLHGRYHFRRLGSH
jgi:DnaJ domain